MPKADFYAGLPLAEQLEKLVEHHHDRRVRHISQDEAAILNAAVARLKAGIATRHRRSEFDDVWRRLEHVYETTILSEASEFRLLVTSIPARTRNVPANPRELLPPAWVVATASASPRLAQIGLNVLLRRALDPEADILRLWSASEKRRSPPMDRSFGERENELLNRALYHPTIAIEESPPVFSSLSAILGQASDPSWQALVAETAGDPVTILGIGATLIVLKVLRGPADGLSQGLKERVYQWARPNEDATGQRQP